MVNQYVLEDSGQSTKLATVNKKHCDYNLLDRLAQNFGLHIIVGSRLPRGGWESWIDKRKCLESVMRLPRGGRGTRRPDQQPITHAKSCSEDHDQLQRGRQARSENLDQVPFNESEWAVNALLLLLQHPDLRF